MGLPIVTALIGVGISIAGIGVLANVLSTPDFAPQVAAMIGIGVGIDYALFIVTRYRTALASHVVSRSGRDRSDEHVGHGPSSSPA